MEKTATHTLYTRWIEVKLADGRIIRGDKGPTLVQDGQPKPTPTCDVIASWERVTRIYGHPIVSASFRYRKRR